MPDAQTLAVYEAQAEAYAARFDRVPAEDGAFRAFLDALPAEGPVLDLGCGPGNWASGFREAGRTVEAWDAAAAMVDAARARGVDARQATFDDLAAEAVYAGIWANFSLLHAPRAALPGHLAAIRRALRPGGAFHLGMKTGAGEIRNGLGRRYTLVGAAETDAMLAEAGFAVLRRHAGQSEGLDGTVAPWLIRLARRDD